MLQEKDEETERLLRALLRNVTLGAWPADTKIPSENQLTKCYVSDIYHVRKALSILKRNGIFYSVPKLGVFVSDLDPTVNRNEDVIFSGNPSEYSTVVFCTRSWMKNQRNIWNKVEEEFTRQNLFIKLKISPGITEELLPKGDLYEFSNYHIDFHPKEEFLDIAQYFSEKISYPELMLDPYSIPIYYSTHLLSYNIDLLEKLGFAPPDYQNFEEQQIYLESVLRKTAEHPGLSFPGTSQSVISHFGKYLPMMYQDLLHDISLNEFRDKYRDVIVKSTDLKRRYPASAPKRNAVLSMENFLDGRTPFFFGWNIDLIKQRNQGNTPFRWGCAMMYTIDDSFLRRPLMLAIRKDTEYPMECLHLIRLFQEEKYRKLICKQGGIPLFDGEYKDLPYNLIIPPEKKGGIFFRQSREEEYVCSNIIDSELWNVILAEKDLDDAISDMKIFSRCYLKMKQKLKENKG